MYWQKKYDYVKCKNIQMISDTTMRKAFRYNYSEALFLEEVVFPTFRADVIEFREVNNKKVIIGYEFKSDRDSTDRLEQQLRGYLTYCNYVFVLCTRLNYRDILKILNVPEFSRVGLRLYTMTDTGNFFNSKRKAKYKDLRDAGLNMDWITDNNKLSLWDYWLKEAWGINV